METSRKISESRYISGTGKKKYNRSRNA